MLLGKYSPQAEFVTVGKFLKVNNYLNPQEYSSDAVDKSNATEIVLKYEYDKYYQVNIGFKYFSSKEYLYFRPDTREFPFDDFLMGFTDAKSFNWFADFLFHTGPYGVCYGRFDYHQIENSDGNNIPYHPKFKASLSYGYSFTKQFSGTATLLYLSKRFTDLTNSFSLNSFVNAALKVEYRFAEQILFSLHVTNLFNTKHYLWQNYQEKPLDLIAGISVLFN